MDNIKYFLQKKTNNVKFMDIKNVVNLTKKIYKLHRDSHGMMKYTFFKTLVPQRMKQWKNKNNINLFKPLTETNLNTLEYINNKFINDMKDLYINPENKIDTNVYRSEITIEKYMDDNNNIVSETKKYEDMLASDIQNIDTGKRSNVYIDNSNYRYSNIIPEWKTSLQVRHYDRRNEGLQHYNKNRASLENQIHGYNMKSIKKIHSGRFK